MKLLLQRDWFLIKSNIKIDSVSELSVLKDADSSSLNKKSWYFIL